SALFAGAGLPSAVPVGAFFDVFPVSVMTMSTLDRLNELRPESRFDERRFRMNVMVDTRDSGFIENDWVGRGLELGHDVRLSITIPDPRCVMTTQPQADLPEDTQILPARVRHNRLDGLGVPYLFACGYGPASAPGATRRGDPATLN